MFKILRVLAVIALAVVLIGAVALFLLKDRLVSHGLELARTSLTEEGIHLGWKPAPARFSGLSLAVLLEDVTLYQDAAAEQVAARLTGLDFRLHLWESLLARAPRLGVSTGNATLTFLHPDPAQTDHPELTGLNLHAEVHPDRVEMLSSTANFRGIGLELSGTVALPPQEKTPFVQVVEVPKPADTDPSPKAPVGIDLSLVFELATALDYRKAEFSPSLMAHFTATTPDTKTSRVELALEMVSFPSRDRGLSAAADVWMLPDGNTEIRSLTIRDGDASAEGTASLPPGGNALAIPEFRSALDWVAILRDLPALERGLDAVTLTRAPVIEVSGSWSFADPKASQLDGTMRGLSGSWAPPAEPAEPGSPASTPRAPLGFADGNADFTLAIGDLRVTQGTALLAGGPVRFQYGTKLFQTPPAPWTLTLNGENVSLGALTASFGDQTLPGKVQLSFEGGGGTSPAELHGKGSLAIVSEEPLKIPVVGPLIDLLQGVVPSLAGARSDQMQASYVIDKGVMTTQDLAISVSAAEVKASGTIDFASEATSFQANANLRGVLGQFTSGVSQVLAVEGGGPFRDVKWRFKNLQNVQSITDLLKGGLKLPGTPQTQPQTPPQEPGATAPAETPMPAGKAGEILRSVDRIGGMLRELKEPVKPATPPVPPATPPAP